jgi:hypothetical protein
MSRDAAPVNSKTWPTCGDGWINIRVTMSATSRAATGEVRPSPKGSLIVPFRRIDARVSIPKSGFSMNTVGRMCVTGRPDQFRTR